MRIHSIIIKNFRPFAKLEETRLGPLATIVGKNDVGKSNILRALELFLKSNPKISEDDFHKGADEGENLEIEVLFDNVPEKIEMEEGVETTFNDEMLLDNGGYLRIRKTFKRTSLSKHEITIITNDFKSDIFSGLSTLKETELNKLCESIGIEVTKSGRGITNKSKREALRNKAKEEGIELNEKKISLITKDDLWRTISSLFPEFLLFETDTRLGIDETQFQNKFKPIITNSVNHPELIEVKDSFTGFLENALQEEIDKLFLKFKKHTDVFVSLKAVPEFQWEKAVNFRILGEDTQGIISSLDQRGSGIRRLLMVAFFQYFAERENNTKGDYIFGVEEPENCLHPGLQRELIDSFRTLANEGYQVIITSHSPVFAGASPIDDLVLVVRDEGVASSIQTPKLDLSEIVYELGVDPSDQITGYNACVFVEGPSDIEFWNTTASKLKDSGHIDSNFDDKKIGFIMCGGETLKYWINQRTMSRLNRKFGVVIDSDRKSIHHNIPACKLKWKEECKEQGGVLFILRKREIENYLHPDAIERSNRELTHFDEFSDMRKLFGDNVYKVIKDMTSEEILYMDKYDDEEGNEKHELKEIINKLLTLTE